MTAQPRPGKAATPGALGALSVVIPVYNEERWITVSVEALRVSARAAGLDPEIVIVDDGSTDNTAAVLDELSRSAGVRVVAQPNQGRLAARRAGIAAASHPTVLLLDSRVLTQPDALRWLRDQVAGNPERRVWCGHVDVEMRGNLFAAFWSGLVKIGWRRYTARPRLVSFGTEEFDYFPKGTGCLLAPRELLAEAATGFQSLYEDARLASDDTRMLRHIASRERFWISPEFAFRYHGKAGLRGFLRQAYFRGTTFIDGYLGQAGAIRRALIAAMAATVIVAGVFVVAPLLGLACVAVGLIAVPTVVRLVGGSWYEVRAAAALAPVFLPVFAAGLARGLFLAASRGVRARSASAT